MFVTRCAAGMDLGGFIFIGFGLSAVLYYFFVYRAVPSATSGFELPGAHSRRRIKELQAQSITSTRHTTTRNSATFIFNRQFEKAEASYRAAMERDPKDFDTRAHLANACSARNAPPKRARCSKASLAENPKHEYGYTMMALAERWPRSVKPMRR